MNANDQFFARDAKVDSAAVEPLPASRKIYVQGSRADIRVPMREIAQTDTPASFGAERTRRWPSTTHPARTPIPMRGSTSVMACRRFAPNGSAHAATRRPSRRQPPHTVAPALPIRRWRDCASICTGHRAARKPAPM